MFSQNKIKQIQLLSEEALCQMLPDTEMVYALDYSEKLGTVEINITYKGEDIDPMTQSENEISMAIINNMTEKVEYTYADGTNKFTMYFSGMKK